MKINKYFALLIVILSLSSITVAQVGKIFPVDESKKDSAFYIFYCQLHSITDHKDINALASKLVDTFMIVVEGQGNWVSKKEFLEFHKTEDNYKELWSILNDVFTIGGGKFKKTGEGKNKTISFHAPYITPSLFNDNINRLFDDTVRYSIIIADSVLVYKNKSTNSKIIATLNYDIVENVTENNEFDLPRKWLHIRLKNGEKGYVEGKYISDFCNVECEFIFENRTWKVKSIFTWIY